MSKRYNQEQVLELFRNKHGDRYDYSKVQFTKVVEKVKIICDIHGEFDQVVHYHWSGSGCPKCGLSTRAKTKALNEKQVFDLNGKSLFEIRYSKIHSTRRKNDSYASAAKQMILTKSTIGEDNLDTFQRAAKKRQKTMVEINYHIDPSLLPAYKTYQRAVRNETRKNIKRYGNLIQQKKLKEELDHIYSIYDGFKNNVDLELIGHICNCRYISLTANRSKNLKSHISLQELKNSIDHFNKFGVLIQK